MMTSCILRRVFHIFRGLSHGKRIFQTLAEFFCPSLRSVENRNAFHTVFGCALHDSARHAAGSDDHDAASSQIDASVGKRLEKSSDIRIIAYELSIGDFYRIDRLIARRLPIDLIDRSTAAPVYEAWWR